MLLSKSIFVLNCNKFYDVMEHFFLKYTLTIPYFPRLSIAEDKHALKVIIKLPYWNIRLLIKDIILTVFFSDIGFTAVPHTQIQPWIVFHF